MANTDNKNELDSYGVWVKKSPESDSQKSESIDDFNFDVDLPDFSEINSSVNEQAQSDASAVEDVSIEDFLDNGFSEPPVPDDTLGASADTAPDFFGAAEETQNDSISFPVSSEIEDASVLPELPESIDTTFSTAETSAPAEASVTEDVDLSDFGVDFSNDEAPSDTESGGSVSPAKTESAHIDYDLSVAPDDGALSSAQTQSVVPDSFDEEAKSLMDNIAAPRTESNDLLRQIVEDLSGLKNEISSLKTQFAELKSRGGTPAAEVQAGGFFNNLDEDETISLSGDELDNIMSSADFLNNESKVDELAEENKIVDGTQTEDISVVPDISEKNKSTDDFFVQETKTDTAGELPIAPGEEEELEELPEEAELEDLSDAEPLEDISIPSVDDILRDVAPASQSEPNSSGNDHKADIADKFSKTDSTSETDDFFKTDVPAQDTSSHNAAFTDAESTAAKPALKTASQNTSSSLPANLTEEIKSVLLYMDQLLEDLPEEKIVEFARSEQFATYKKLFSDLGLS